MLTEVKTNSEYEVRAYEFQVGAKTFRISEKTYGTWEVISHATKNPCQKVFWGSKAFNSLAEVEQHYKSLRGISRLISDKGN